MDRREFLSKTAAISAVSLLPELSFETTPEAAAAVATRHFVLSQRKKPDCWYVLKTPHESQVSKWFPPEPYVLIRRIDDQDREVSKITTRMGRCGTLFGYIHSLPDIADPIQTQAGAGYWYCKEECTLVLEKWAVSDEKGYLWEKVCDITYTNVEWKEAFHTLPDEGSFCACAAGFQYNTKIEAYGASTALISIPETEEHPVIAFETYYSLFKSKTLASNANPS